MKIYLKNGRLLFQCEKGFPDTGFAARLLLFGGAGYRNGFTAYLAYNSGKRHWQHQFRNGRRTDGSPAPWLSRVFKLEAGITRNANMVPYMNH